MIDDCKFRERLDVCVLSITLSNEAFSNQRSAISVQQSAFSNQRSAISVQQSAFSNQRSAISNQQSAISFIVISFINSAISLGGEGGIRTHGTVSRTQHFQCCQLSRSCTSPICPPPNQFIADCGLRIADCGLQDDDSGFVTSLRMNASQIASA